MNPIPSLTNQELKELELAGLHVTYETTAKGKWIRKVKPNPRTPEEQAFIERALELIGNRKKKYE